MNEVNSLGLCARTNSLIRACVLKTRLVEYIWYK